MSVYPALACLVFHFEGQTECVSIIFFTLAGENKNMISVKKLSLLILLVVSFSSCVKETEKPSWELGVLSPIIETTIDVNDIIPDSFLSISPDKQVKVVYNSVLYRLALDTLFNNKTDITVSNFWLPFNYPLKPDCTFLAFNSTRKFDFDLAMLRQVIVDNGFLTIVATNKYTEELVCTYSLPAAKKNGKPLTIIETVAAAPSKTQAFTFSKTYDIRGYEIDFTHKGQSVNTIEYFITAKLSPKANPYTISAFDTFQVRTYFSDVNLYYAKGYFGNDFYNIGPSITKVDVFRKVKSGSFSLDQAKMYFRIENGLGVDARFFVNQIKTINTNSGIEIPITGSFVSSNINIGRALETHNPLNLVQFTDLVFDVDNNLAKQIIENMPDQISYKFNLETNPLGNISNGNDFLFKSFPLKASVGIEIPFNTRFNMLEFEEKFKFHYSQSENSELKNAKFSVIADNGYPFDAFIQFYMLNNKGQVIDSLLNVPGNKVLSADLDIGGKTIGKKRTVLTFTVNQSKLDKMYQTTDMFVNVKINTSSAVGTVKIYDYQKMDIKLIGNLKILVN